MKLKPSAFSLVELSIVLVILGLLTGGILAGKSLIRASELRSVTTEFNRYVTAANAFRDKYFYLPGDLINAASIWGPLDGNNGTGSDCREASTSSLTCSGNGDGQIAPSNANTAGTNEKFLFWQHLANAGLIEGSFSGSGPTATNSPCPLGDLYQPDCNVPSSKLSTGRWVTFWMGPVTAQGYVFDGDYGNILYPAASAGAIYNSIISSPELWNIDTKMDDGLPATGKLVAARWNSCANGASSSADLNGGAYRLNIDGISCNPVFRRVF